MIGTRPTFPVTKELSETVVTGQWPKVETQVRHGCESLASVE
jgi:hypothetical protein